MPEFARATSCKHAFREKLMPKRHTPKQSLVLFTVFALLGALVAAGHPTLHAQSHPAGADKPPAAASSASAAQSPAEKPPTPAPANAATVWVNTDTGVYHKQGSRWYGKTKHGKYMLEADAVKAGYKPAK
jgi:hypothetical protein